MTFRGSSADTPSPTPLLIRPLRRKARFQSRYIGFNRASRPNEQDPQALMVPWPRPIATGGSSSRIAREATAELGFGFTRLVPFRAFKPLRTRLLGRSDNTLHMPTVALFWRLFSVELIPSPSEASGPREANYSARRKHPRM
jgi:hypothetical protein